MEAATEWCHLFASAPLDASKGGQQPPPTNHTQPGVDDAISHERQEVVDAGPQQLSEVDDAYIQEAQDPYAVGSLLTERVKSLTTQCEH